MLRVLVACWIVGVIVVGWLRWRRDHRLVAEQLRADLAAGFLLGTFVWAVILIAF